ncbi:recombinase family protein [Photorhabdus africana]|uniref:recombinase family protein n=1 Tax=Photorhabdus africana TaxID=3097554 RepID=UPI002B418360|nr:recombinase family protein [Photorhabdus sp. CRI-LC]
MHYTYIRVSSVDQHVERQKEALSASRIEIDKIYLEQASAKDINRPQLQEMLKQVRTGDTIIVHSIDRLCRNYDGYVCPAPAFTSARYYTDLSKRTAHV